MRDTQRPARIVIANRGLVFDSDTVGATPLGGAESAVVQLAEALAARGHTVSVYGDQPSRAIRKRVEWIPHTAGLPLRADLFIANRDHEWLTAVPFARHRVLWLHNPGRKIDSLPYRLKLALLPATIVVLGAYHRGTCPAWLTPGRIETIPLGLAEAFLAAPERPPPAARAIFTSNPTRNLDWLLKVWATRISPAFPVAELDIFSGPEVYQMTTGTGFDAMGAILARAEGMAAFHVRRHRPVGRDALIGRLLEARVMLYRGHEEETFCLALAEAQALGLPCVVQDIGSAAERVIDGVTGFVTGSDEAFAERAIQLLSDDALWARMHRAALARQRSRRWSDVAADFERLLPRT